MKTMPYYKMNFTFSPKGVFHRCTVFHLNSSCNYMMNYFW